MNTDNLIPSILHVTAKENLNIDHDLASDQTKTIGQLLQDNEEKEENHQKSNG
jgi:hypothetical protein